MKIMLVDETNNKSKVIEFDDLPVYLCKGAVVDDLPRWVKCILPFEQMQHRATNQGHIVYFKTVKEYSVLYKIKKEKE